MFRRSFFYRYLSPYAGRLLFNALLRVLSALFTMVLLLGVAPVLSLLFGRIDAAGGVAAGGLEMHDVLSETVIQTAGRWVQGLVAAHGSVAALGIVCAVLFGLYFLKNLFAYLGLYLFTPIRNSVVARMRNDLFERLMVLPLSFFASQRKGDLISRLSSDVQEIDEGVLNQVQQVLTDLAMVILLVAGLFMLSARLSLIVLVLLPVTGFLTGFFSKMLRRASPKQQASLGRLITQTEETVDGIKTLRSYNTEDFSIDRFKAEGERFYDLKVKVLRRVDLGSPVSEVIGTVAVVCILMVGGYYILGERGVLSPEAFITYLLTMTMILQPAKNLTTAYYSIQRGKGSVRRVKEILFADEVVMEAEHPVALPSFESAIEWRGVSFRYGDAEAVSHIDLRIPKGRYVAIVGPSGGGKSTLINMIPRFYDATEGEVLIDGRNIKDYRIDDVRGLSALVSQDTVLFNDTIFNNIQLGNRRSSAMDVKRAAEEANAMDFIRESENGFKTLIGDGGCKLSGGQRQRLGIARALLKDAPILILDEASSALDTESESMIQQALERQTGARERTIISVAHRLSTIQHADEIIVMDKGRIVERGTHETLLRAGGLYTRLCRMQQVE